MVRLLSQKVGEQTDRPLMQLLVLKYILVLDIHSQAVIAERLLIDAPAVSRLVDRLEEDGLVERRAGENRRCVRLEATDAGRREFQALERATEWLDEEARAQLSPGEFEELSRLLEKLQGGLLLRLASPPPGNNPCATARKDE
ncbi:MarR family winged helix-turn-helix transcriptional regulator [Corallococcus sp. bb12-1]|uniref:MarR family winged helix-turn-helix transcriptional regulator n=1 Tax=Corallococcus sp. bb12-1 TaxID=2996784 RepID=UPI0022706C87|nr:MarR family winged helix-turn-helix transcriptional regulator [Corallococcus sp. bb12-1]MCY1041246.1 MarR family winged helix-turn-helix transcriptional regulator [Corallococcus sp. bb12-1]